MEKHQRHTARLQTARCAVKRLADIAGGLVGTAAAGLLCIPLAPMIYLSSPGPIFFRQKRVGRNGQVFTMYKFRSMVPDAEAHKAELMKQNHMTDGRMFKLENDPRVIGFGKRFSVGRLLRSTSLDEFPQFLNVLRNEMSLVGTRPPTLDEWALYDEEQKKRMSIKPGITGLWQVSGRSEITDFDEVLRLDREYIENWSVGLDLRILIKTVGVVLKRKGTY